jgi:prepilin-type processing-associated H-X9-DG protein
MKIWGRKKVGAAFTLLEVMVVIFVVGLLAFLLLPGFSESHCKAVRINCTSNLKQVGLAFRIWEGDCGDKYPQYYAGNPKYAVINSDTPLNPGLMATAWPKLSSVNSGQSCPNMYTVFLAMSNELSNPKLLTCPADSRSPGATNFTTDLFALKNKSTSYFIGQNADETQPQMFLAGDRNIGANTTQTDYGYSCGAGGQPIDGQGYMLALGTNATAAPLLAGGWTRKIHQNAGNVGLADGSVQQFTVSALRSAASRTADTNSLANVLLFP